MGCNLLDDTGLVVQGMLGFCAFLILVVKRYQEHPRRPLKIWSFDASKQAWSATLVHMCNVFLSKVDSGETDSHDDCTWYFMNVLLDSTIGLTIVYFMLKGSASYFHKRKMILFYSGEYGPGTQYRPWLYQMAHYSVVALVAKLVVFAIIQIPFWIQIGNFVLEPLSNHSETLELILAMLIFPFVINCLYFWFIDNILMNAETRHKQLLWYSQVRYSRLPQQQEDPFEQGLLEDLGSDAYDSDDEVVWAVEEPVSPV